MVKQTVVVAQLVERSLPTTEIYGLNPNIGKFYLPIAHLNRKGENKVKEAGNGPSFLKNLSVKQFSTISGEGSFRRLAFNIGGTQRCSRFPKTVASAQKLKLSPGKLNRSNSTKTLDGLFLFQLRLLRVILAFKIWQRYYLKTKIS